MAAPSERHVYQYAVWRVVPRVERDETVAAGVVLLCRPRRFLAARVRVDGWALQALDPALDLNLVEAQLRLLDRIAAGDPTAGPIAALAPAERFHWLTSPANTVIQPSTIHAGLTADPAATLDRLFAELVSRDSFSSL